MVSKTVLLFLIVNDEMEAMVDLLERMAPKSRSKNERREFTTALHEVMPA